MNRQQRRQLQALYRRAGMTKEQAKASANQYIGDTLKEGDLVRFNYQLMVRHPQWKLQKEEFKEWVIAHKDDILTVDKTKDNGTQVTFVEDTQEEQFWHLNTTLIPVASATIKLDDGTEKKIAISDINNVNEEVNNALEGEN